jgi:Concanavalin A-like lectin/glucanases superfamily
MDEPSGSTMVDGVGGNNGTLHDVQLGQPGASGLAYGFNGSTSVVTVPNSASLNPGTSPFWMSAQVKFTGTPTAAIGGDYDLMRKGLSGTTGGFYKMELLPSSGRVRAHCSMEGSLTSHSLTAGPDLRDGQWHTIQCLKDDSSLSVVVDGVKSSTSVALGSFGNSAAFAVGAKAEGGDWYEGLLDEASFGTSVPGDTPTPPTSPAPPPTSTGPPAAPVASALPAPATVVSAPDTAGDGESCVRLLPEAVLRKANLGGDAKLTLRFDAHTGVLRLRAPHGKVRSVVLMLDGKRLSSARGGTLRVVVKTKSLVVGKHVLRAVVHPQHGKVRSLTVHLTSTPC